MKWYDIPGWTDEYLLALYDEAVVRAPSDMPSLFVEVGVAFGRSLAYADGLIRVSGKTIGLIGFDPWVVPDWMAPEHRAIVEAHGGFEQAAKRLLFAADVVAALVRAPSVAGAAMLGGSPLDFVFIDADHTHESLLADLRAWWPLVRSGGVIAGHDHTPNFPGIEQACREFFGPDGYEVRGTCFRKEKP